MDCTVLREQLSDFHDGFLAGAVADEVSRHLEACSECAEIDRTLGALREQLRRLAPLPAPPELLARVRESVARESAPGRLAVSAGPARPFALRMRIPLQAAAAVLLVATVFWYQHQGTSVPPPVGKTTVEPARTASSTPPAAARRATPGTSGRPVAAARRPAAPDAGHWASLERDMRREGVSSLPPDTPEPKVRVWSRADLPAAPALRAGTDAERIVPGFPVGRLSAERASATTGADGSRRIASLGNARDVLLEVTPESRVGAEERVAAAARDAGGSVERMVPEGPDGGGAVRVILPEQAVPAFLEGLARIGTVPPEGRAAEGDRSAHPGAGTVVCTVNLRVR